MDIKFRVWDKENEFYDDDFNLSEELYGLTISSNNHIFEQYIGLKNKNGKEIYEGDWIKADNQKWLVEPIGSLERDGHYFGLCVSPDGNGDNYFIDESILKGEIVGNIHENPELLEKN